MDIETIENIDSLEKLKRKMLKAAKNLQFEKAAIIRDKIKEYEDNINIEEVKWSIQF